MSFIRIDPGNARCGLAALRKDGAGRLTLSMRKTLIRTRAVDVRAAVESLVATFDLGDDDLVAIEDQLLGPNPHTMAKIVEARTRWLQEFESAGIRVVLVAPQTWSSATVIRMPTRLGPVKGNSPREVRKLGAIAWAKAAYGLAESEGDDVAEAVAISHWAAYRGEAAYSQRVA